VPCQNRDFNNLECCCFQRRRERFFLFPSPLFFFLSFSISFTSGCLFVLLVLLFNKISLPGFKLPLNLSFLSLLRYSLFGHFLSSLQFVPFSLFLCYFSASPHFFPTLFSFSLCVFLFLFPHYLLAMSVVFIRQRGAGGVPTAALSLCVGSDANLPCHGAGLGNQRAWVCRAGPCWFFIMRGHTWGFGF